MEVVDQSTLLMSYSSVLLVIEWSSFLHLSRNARLRPALCRFLSHLKASYKDSSDSKINLGGIWTFRQPPLRYNNVHVSETYIKLVVNVCFNAWLEDLSW